MIENTNVQRPRTVITVAATVVIVLATAILIELLSSELLLYRYRRSGQIDDGSLSSAVALLTKVGSNLGLVSEPGHLKVECNPRLA